MVNSAVANVGTRRPPIKPVRGAAQLPEPKVTLAVYSQNSSVAVVTSTNSESMALGVDPVEAKRTKACGTGTFDPGRRGPCGRAWRRSPREARSSAVCDDGIETSNP
jgi:hypothetical protein